MRRLTAGLAIMALAVTGCATTVATSSGGKAPAAATSQSPATGTSSTATAGIRPGGSSGSGSSGLAQWVVNGTFETEAGHVQPLSGEVTFRDSTTGHTVNVTVGASGKFSLGLIAGTYTATGQTEHSDSPCSAPVTVTVRAGQLTRVSLVCKAS
jgi:hypothetical protein